MIHCDSETYLGVIVSTVTLRIERSHKQCAPFIKKSNHVIANYSRLDSFSRCKLHSSFCMSLYGSELWNYNSRYIEKKFRLEKDNEKVIQASV